MCLTFHSLTFFVTALVRCYAEWSEMKLVHFFSLPALLIPRTIRENT